MKISDLLKSLASGSSLPRGKRRRHSSAAGSRLRFETLEPRQVLSGVVNVVQVGNSLTRQHDGVGLGLPLTKRLVELHGGTIEIDSEPGKGTIASVHLPEERLCRTEHALAV